MFSASRERRVDVGSHDLANGRQAAAEILNNFFNNWRRRPRATRVRPKFQEAMSSFCTMAPFLQYDGDVTMLERRHFLGAGLGSVLIPTLAVAQAQPPRAGGSGQLGLGANSAAECLNELGPENAAMAAYPGLWDVTETVWDKPGGNRSRRRGSSPNAA
jgi:hypothetical protein